MTREKARSRDYEFHSISYCYSNIGILRLCRNSVHAGYLQRHLVQSVIARILSKSAAPISAPVLASSEGTIKDSSINTSTHQVTSQPQPRRRRSCIELDRVQRQLDLTPRSSGLPAKPRPPQGLPRSRPAPCERTLAPRSSELHASQRVASSSASPPIRGRLACCARPRLLWPSS